MKTSHEINIPTSILLAIISFFLVKTYNRVEEISSRQYEFEKRITRIETKLFGENLPKENSIFFPKVYGVLTLSQKSKEDETV
jgi:hypothetical protein